jgi:hypothetical protein
MAEIFISYCQKDSSYVDLMDSYFEDKNVTLHRDIRDISPWKSIREYMQTIRDTDYAVLLISEKYLKSFNCMYEVLEVMKEQNNKNRIFPAVLETRIYDTSCRVEYVKYWQDKYKELGNQMSQIDMVNASGLIEDLRRTQNIAASMSEFLALVADMNNPSISDINVAIEDKLKEDWVIGKKSGVPQSKTQPVHDVFSSLNITRVNAMAEPTDLEKNQFMIDSFIRINELLEQLCNQIQNDISNIKVLVERLDTKNVIFRFYVDGNQVRGLKLFIGNTFGGRDMNIGISTDMFSMGNNNSFNGILSLKFEKGQLLLFSMMSMSMNQRTMTVEEAVKDIWESYIQPYIKR